MKMNKSGEQEHGRDVSLTNDRTRSRWELATLGKAAVVVDGGDEHVQ